MGSEEEIISFNQYVENIVSIIKIIDLVFVTAFIIIALIYLIKLLDLNGSIKEAENKNDEESLKKYRREKEKLNDKKNIFMAILLMLFAASYYLTFIKHL